jgi:hypothetical protein
VKAWPAVVVLGFFLAARARLTRKPQFVTLGLVVGFASRYLALSLVVFVANYWLSRHSDDGIAASWFFIPFATAFVLGLAVPFFSVGVLYRIWIRRRSL